MIKKSISITDIKTSSWVINSNIDNSHLVSSARELGFQPLQKVKLWSKNNINKSIKNTNENSYYIDEYQEITYQSIKQHQNYLILLETGDEILNYKHAVQFYDKASIIIEEGGDHRFVSYSKHLPTIYNFLFSNSQSKSF